MGRHWNVGRQEDLTPALRRAFFEQPFLGEQVRSLYRHSLVGRVATFNSAREIANSIDLVGDDLAQLEARNPIFYRDYYFEAIKPVGSEIVAKAGLVARG